MDYQGTSSPKKKAVLIPFEELEKMKEERRKNGRRVRRTRRHSLSSSDSSHSGSSYATCVEILTKKYESKPLYQNAIGSGNIYPRFSNTKFLYEFDRDYRAIIRSGYLLEKQRLSTYKRYWCVLKDDRIDFFYHPCMKEAFKTISIQGFHVEAHPMQSFKFKLLNKDKKKFSFKSDNMKDFFLWLGCLEKLLSPNNKKSNRPRNEDSTHAEVKPGKRLVSILKKK